MSWKDTIVASWRLMEQHGRPSIVGAIRIARECGARFNDKEARTLLRAFSQKVTQIPPSSHPDSTQQNTHVYPDDAQSLPKKNLGSRAHSKVSLVTKYPDSNESDTAATASASPPVDNPKRKRRGAQTDVPFDADPGVLKPIERPEMGDLSQPLWVRQMREWSVAIVNRKLSELTPDELLKLARYHAWRWANCTVDPARNVAAAAKIVCGIKTLADDRRYGATTVNDYIVAGDDLWEKQGRKPMHPVWPIISQLERAA